MNKLIIYIGIVCLVILSGKVTAQENETFQRKAFQPPIPVEAFGGINSSMYQLSVSKQLTPGSKFGFFNLVNYEVDYDQTTPNSYILQTLFTYNITKRFNIGAGANLKAFGGFRPIVSASYSIFNQNIGFLVQPIYELNKNGLVEVFSLFEWHPSKDIKVKPYFRVQGLLAFKNQHDFSYHYWRAGIQYQNFRFGPGLNVQYFGPQASSVVNFGGFVNILIN